MHHHLPPSHLCFSSSPTCCCLFSCYSQTSQHPRVSAPCLLIQLLAASEGALVLLPNSFHMSMFLTPTQDHLCRPFICISFPDCRCTLTITSRVFFFMISSLFITTTQHYFHHNIYLTIILTVHLNLTHVQDPKIPQLTSLNHRKPIYYFLEGSGSVCQMGSSENDIISKKEDM